MYLPDHCRTIWYSLRPGRSGIIRLHDMAGPEPNFWLANSDCFRLDPTLVLILMFPLYTLRCTFILFSNIST